MKKAKFINAYRFSISGPRSAQAPCHPMPGIARAWTGVAFAKKDRVCSWNAEEESQI
jgi:hypothetical protein